MSVWDLGARTAPFTAVLYCELDPGGAVGTHVQETDDEVVIVVGGVGSIVVDGLAQRCAVGGAIAVPLRSRLAIENLSAEEPLRYLIVKARR